MNLASKKRGVLLPKKIVIVHPNLPIKATSPQRPLSSVPKLAVVERLESDAGDDKENWKKQ